MDFTWVKRKDCKVLLQDSTLVELTIDYRHIAIEGSVEVITGGQEKIIGLSPKEALLQSAQQLINLIQEVDDIHCFNLPKAPD
ncbi:MAG: hypothetical protein AN488_01560 [Anabaena sp. WA113]|jgi:hypothetical protein|nr:hypothetical protein [Nostocales cyanobacterium W4_Combined_metabat2_030]OBQ24320.1 MAG: hypothetical protein AN488_01560 [Anabaena sp. WA113]